MRSCKRIWELNETKSSLKENKIRERKEVDVDKALENKNDQTLKLKSRNVRKFVQVYYLTSTKNFQHVAFIKHDNF